MYTPIDADVDYDAYTILCLIPRSTMTSLSAPKDTHCKAHTLYVNPGVPFRTREKTHNTRDNNVFLRNTRWRHGRSRGETKYSDVDYDAYTYLHISDVDNAEYVADTGNGVDAAKICRLYFV